MWLELSAQPAGEGESSTTWIDLSKAHAVTIYADKAVIALGGETYEATGVKDIEQLQNWLLRKKQSQSG